MPYRWRVLLVQWLFGWGGPFHIAGAVVVLPFAQMDLGVSRSAIAWLVVAFSMTTASFVLPAAYLGNAWSRRKMVVIGATLEALSQIGLFLVPGFTWLIPIRMLGGLGNAMILANLPPLVVLAYPPERRGRALGLMGFGTGWGMLLSSVIAGLLADTLGWRYLFLTTSSMYVALALAGILVVKDAPAQERRPISMARFDFMGLLLIASCIITLAVATQRLGDPSTILLGGGLFILSGALGSSFVIWEWRFSNPLIDPRLFRQRMLSVTTVYNVGAFLLRQCSYFLLPFYLIQGIGWSGSAAGAALMAFNLGQPLVSPIAGYVIDRVGAQGPIRISFGLLLLGGLLQLTLGSSPQVAHILVALLVLGAGFAVFATASGQVIFGSVPRDKINLAQGVMAVTGHGTNVVGPALAATLLRVFASEGIPIAYQRSMMVILGIFVAAVVIGLVLWRRLDVRPSKALQPGP
ncbi:MAG: MFS transporter [Chloroflexi bacterium]|nr:MFS transporter [Chloroflexota bacterium]